jgi:hypothetical protein
MGLSAAVKVKVGRSQRHLPLHVLHVPGSSPLPSPLLPYGHRHRGCHGRRYGVPWWPRYRPLQPLSCQPGVHRLLCRVPSYPHPLRPYLRPLRPYPPSRRLRVLPLRAHHPERLCVLQLLGKRSPSPDWFKKVEESGRLFREKLEGKIVFLHFTKKLKQYSCKQ